MRVSPSLSLTAAILMTMSAASASAQPARHHVRHRQIVPSDGYGYGYYPTYGGWQAAAIAAAAAQAQREPGVTAELAPDAVQTATGGPVGGVPGFSGGR